MNSRKWVRFFFSTLFLGGISTVVLGFVLKWSKYEPYILHFNGKELLSIFVWLLGMGFLFSVISQMGFFAYLTLHRFGLGMFRSVSLWNIVQIILMVVTFIDFIYLRAKFVKVGHTSVATDSVVAVVLLVFSLMVAYMKRKETNKQAFVPALFFMFVVTIVEWIPALRANDVDWLYLMGIPLFVCNAYQILVLHRIVKNS